METKRVQSTLSIRRGVPSDAAPLATFAARTFAETFGPQNRASDMELHLATAYGEALQARELADPNYATLLIEDGDALVAFAQLRRTSPPACVTGDAPIEVYRFYVDSAWHGQGVAQRLMAAAHETARSVGARTLYLSVWERNPRAIAFYSRCGYHDVGTADFFVGPDRQTDRVLMMDVADVKPVAT